MTSPSPTPAAPDAARPASPAGERPSGGAERPVRLEGVRRPPPLGRLGRGLVYGTGLFLLRPLVVLLHALVGWRRRATLAWSGSELVLHSELSLLGVPIRREAERIRSARLVSVAVTEGLAPEPLVVGALALTVAFVWGLLQVAAGIYGRSFGLVLLGAGAMAAGVVLDLAIFWAARRLPGLARHGVAVRTVEGRLVAIEGVAPEAAERLAEAVTRGLG